MNFPCLHAMETYASIVAGKRDRVVPSYPASPLRQNNYEGTTKSPTRSPAKKKVSSEHRSTSTKKKKRQCCCGHEDCHNIHQKILDLYINTSPQPKSINPFFVFKKNQGNPDLYEIAREFVAETTGTPCSLKEIRIAKWHYKPHCRGLFEKGGPARGSVSSRFLQQYCLCPYDVVFRDNDGGGGSPGEECLLKPNQPKEVFLPEMEHYLKMGKVFDTGPFRFLVDDALRGMFSTTDPDEIQSLLDLKKGTSEKIIIPFFHPSYKDRHHYARLLMLEGDTSDVFRSLVEYVGLLGNKLRPPPFDANLTMDSILDLYTEKENQKAEKSKQSESITHVPYNSQKKYVATVHRCYFSKRDEKYMSQLDSTKQNLSKNVTSLGSRVETIVSEVTPSLNNRSMTFQLGTKNESKPLESNLVPRTPVTKEEAEKSKKCESTDVLIFNNREVDTNSLYVSHYNTKHPLESANRSKQPIPIYVDKDDKLTTTKKDGSGKKPPSENIGYVRVGDCIAKNSAPYENIIRLTNHIGRSAATVFSTLGCNHAIDRADVTPDPTIDTEMKQMCQTHLNPTIGLFVMLLLRAFIEEYDFDNFDFNQLDRFIWLMWNPFALCFMNSVDSVLQDCMKFSVNAIQKRVEDAISNTTDPKPSSAQRDQMKNEAIYKALLFHYFVIVSYTQALNDGDCWQLYRQIMHRVHDSLSLVEWLTRAPFHIIHNIVTEMFRHSSLFEARTTSILSIAICSELFYDGGFPEDTNYAMGFFQIKRKKKRLVENAAIQLQTWLKSIGITNIPQYVGVAVDDHVEDRILSMAKRILEEERPGYFDTLSNADKDKLVNAVSVTLPEEQGIVMNELFGQIDQFIASGERDKSVKDFKDRIFKNVLAQTDNCFVVDFIRDWDG